MRRMSRRRLRGNQSFSRRPSSISAADALHRVGLELGAEAFLVAVDGVEQAHHAVLDDVLHLHAGRQLGHEVIGDALDQRRVLDDELFFIEGAGGGVSLSAFWSGYLGCDSLQWFQRQR